MKFILIRLAIFSKTPEIIKKLEIRLLYVKKIQITAKQL